MQAESEIAAINMVYGAAACGVRAMTSSSSPGISLKQEGISYLVGAELPAVIVNMMRGGPGLGSIQPSQADYYQSTRGGGNGDYRTVTLAPANLQEAIELMTEAFDIADQYRNPVMILADGIIGQMMEPVEWKEYTGRNLPPKSWAADGRKGKGQKNFVTSLMIDVVSCEEHNLRLADKFREIEEKECRYEAILCDDAELLIVAYGTPSRIAHTVAENLRLEGMKIGVFRPITLWPYPSEALVRLVERRQVMGVLTVEMSGGQMLDDVRLAVNGRKPVHFYGRMGGSIPKVSDVEKAVRAVYEEVR